jgi:hypothetical protein
MTNLGLLESVAVLRLCVVFREAYNTGILLFSNTSIDIHFDLVHAKFEEGLYISILKKRATHLKNV